MSAQRNKLVLMPKIDGVNSKNIDALIAIWSKKIDEITQWRLREEEKNEEELEEEVSCA
jgi:pantothenate kinase-related protein Tda10